MGLTRIDSDHVNLDKKRSGLVAGRQIRGSSKQTECKALLLLFGVLFN